MFEALKASIVDAIEESQWLDVDSRQKAVSKAKSLRSNLVSNAIFTNSTFIEGMVAEVSMLSRVRI